MDSVAKEQDCGSSKSVMIEEERKEKEKEKEKESCGGLNTSRS